MLSLVTGGKVEVAVVEVLTTETVVQLFIVSGDVVSPTVPMQVLQRTHGAVIRVQRVTVIASTTRISNISDNKGQC